MRAVATNGPAGRPGKHDKALPQGCHHSPGCKSFFLPDAGIGDFAFPSLAYPIGHFSRNLSRCAHAALDDFLKTGIVPEDLKRSGG
jgi:hypothetical protein